MAKHYLAVIAALVTLIGCSKEPAGEIGPEGACTVRFRGAGRSEAIPVASKAIVPVPQGMTVGVLAYQRGGSGAADITADVFREGKTYVTGAGGILTPGQADDAGNPVAGDAAAMELSNGTYDFYAYSPALKLESDHYTIKGIGHYTDFMGAVVPGRAVSRSAADVDLLFEHKCCKIRFNVKTIDGMDNSSLEAEKVILNKMAVSPAADFTVGGDIVPTLGADADACTLEQVEPAIDNKSTSVWDILLPKSSGAFDGKFFLTIEGKRYMLQARDIPAMSFLKSTQYIFTALVREGSVSLVLNVASWDAVSGSVDAGGGNGTGTDPWGGGSGETGGQAGTNHGIEVGRWDNVDWSGGMGGNPDAVTGAVEVGSWTPARVLVDAGGGHVADIDTWVRNELAAQAGADHGGGVGGWDESGFETSIGSGGALRANCGIVGAGAAVGFDVEDRIMQANAAGLAIDWTKGADYTPLLIWQDVAGLVSGVAYDAANGYVTVSTDGAKGADGGNAVVGLFPAGTVDPSGGTCIWSWHVWVTDYEPDGAKEYCIAQNSYADVPGGQVHRYGQKYEDVNGQKVIMDRNLGATKTYYDLVTTHAENYPAYGLLYQWGRKDPFPKSQQGSNSTTPPQTTYDASGTATNYPVLKGGRVPMLNAVQNPHVYYYYNTGIFDWISSSDDTLWGDGTVKSIYDPCPEGWRVPPDGTWGDFTTTTVSRNSSWSVANLDLAGCLYSADAVKTFYPSPGYRNRGNGTFGSNGNYGYYWASSAFADNANHFRFNASTLSPGSNMSRAYGLSLRCIQE